MYIIKLPIVLILSCLSFAHAQKDSIVSDIKIDTSFIINVSPKLSPVVIHFSGFVITYDKNNPYKGEIFYTVEIREGEKTIQSIKGVNWVNDDPLNYDYGNEELPVEESMAVDINFDGYKDLRFMSGAGSNAYAVNQSYNYYLYDPINNQFVLNEDVSGMINPTPYQEEEMVRSYIRNRFAGTDGTVEEYKWDKNKLVLLQTYYYEVIEETCNSDTECKFKRTTEYYKNNEVVGNDIQIINITEIPGYHLLYW